MVHSSQSREGILIPQTKIKLKKTFCTALRRHRVFGEQRNSRRKLSNPDEDFYAGWM
jgi:hypothetical protein